LALNKKPKTNKKFGLSSAQRIRKSHDFQSLRKKSQKWVARHWVLYYAKNDLEKARLAVTLSAKYGSSVLRNRFRRWMREKFRLNQDIFAGFDLHFIARPRPTKLSEKFYKQELNEDFERLLHRHS